MYLQTKCCKSWIMSNFSRETLLEFSQNIHFHSQKILIGYFSWFPWQKMKHNQWFWNIAMDDMDIHIFRLKQSVFQIIIDVVCCTWDVVKFVLKENLSLEKCIMLHIWQENCVSWSCKLLICLLIFKKIHFLPFFT